MNTIEATQGNFFTGAFLSLIIILEIKLLIYVVIMCQPFHKAHQFLDMSPLPTYISYDVMKVLNIAQYR